MGAARERCGEQGQRGRVARGAHTYAAPISRGSAPSVIHGASRPDGSVPIRRALRTWIRSNSVRQQQGRTAAIIVIVSILLWLGGAISARTAC